MADPSPMGVERQKVDDLLLRSERELAPYMGPNVEGSLDLEGVTMSSGWQGVADRMRALLGSAASLASTGSAKARTAAKAAASAIATAAGQAATAVGTAGGALWDQFKAMQRAALNIAGGITLALALAAAYLLFSRYGGQSSGR